MPGRKVNSRRWPSSPSCSKPGIAGSIGTVGDALDNALRESTIGLFKTEAIDDGGPAWADRSVERQVARWVQRYNTRGLHSSIDYLPPIEFEASTDRLRGRPPSPEDA